MQLQETKFKGFRLIQLIFCQIGLALDIKCDVEADTRYYFSLSLNGSHTECNVISHVSEAICKLAQYPKIWSGAVDSRMRGNSYPDLISP